MLGKMRAIALTLMLALLLGTIGVLAGESLAKAATIPAYNQGMANAAVADGGYSVYDPALNANVYAMGDTISVYRQSVNDWGYPHFIFLTNLRGTAGFRVRHYSFGHHSDQAAPDFSSTDYFWPGGLLLTPTTLYVYGARIEGALSSRVIADEVARYSAATLAYEGMTKIPGFVSWSNAVAGPGGHWMIGTVNIPCSYATNCKAAQVAWVPDGYETRPCHWRITLNAIPSSYNLGTVISATKTASGYAAFTKDDFGVYIEKLTAPKMTGPWTLTDPSFSTRWFTPEAAAIGSPPVPCPDCQTYSVQYHGNDLFSYAVRKPYGVRFFRWDF